MSDKLLPCPHCGGKPEHKREGAGNWIVRCTSDGCGASAHGQTRNRLGSISAWNRRPAPSLSAEENEAMRRTIQKDGSLFSLGWYLGWSIGDEDATLDGRFSAAELRAISDHMIACVVDEK